MGEGLVFKRVGRADGSIAGIKRLKCERETSLVVLL